jgi:hypothetical protein
MFIIRVTTARAKQKASIRARKYTKKNLIMFPLSTGLVNIVAPEETEDTGDEEWL